MEKKRPFYKSFKFWGIFLVAIILIGGIGSGLEDDEDVEGALELEQEEPEEEIAEEEVEEVDPMKDLEGEELVEYIIIDTLGEETNMNDERIIEINVFPDGNGVFMKLHGDENLTKNMTKSGMVSNALELSEVLYKTADMKAIDISWEMKLVDSYGNESIGRVILMNLEPDDADNINWDNITTSQFENIALVWKHPNIFD